jgi:hypothetical protein
MFSSINCRTWLLLLSVLLIPVAVDELAAQTAIDPEEQYGIDYERVQKAAAATQMVARANGLYEFMKDRPDSKLTEYAQGVFFQTLDTILKQGNDTAVLGLAERMIQLRPKLGEAFCFYGIALKNKKRYPEALDALAKSYVMKNNTLAAKAKEVLDLVYKGVNKGSLAGQDELIKKARQEVK